MISLKVLLVLMVLGGCATYPYEKTAYYSDSKSCYQIIFYDDWIEDIESVSIEDNMAYVLMKRYYPDKTHSHKTGYLLESYKIKKDKQILFEKEYEDEKPTMTYDSWRKAGSP